MLEEIVNKLINNWKKNIMFGWKKVPSWKCVWLGIGWKFHRKITTCVIILLMVCCWTARDAKKKNKQISGLKSI